MKVYLLWETNYVLWDTNPVEEKTELVDVFSSWDKANEARKMYETLDYAGYFDYWIEELDVK